MGNIASLKCCKMAGPMVAAVGGLLALFFAAWRSRPDKVFETDTNCEEAVITAEH